MFVLISGSLWRDPVARQAKNNKQYVTCLLKSGTPTDAQWVNIVCFDQFAQSELLRLKAGDAVSVQGNAKISIYEKAGAHRASLDVTAAHVLALRQAKPTKSKQDVTPAKPSDHSAPPLAPEFNDTAPF
jgi:single-stranded DNA-binding protein